MVTLDEFRGIVRALLDWHVDDSRSPEQERVARTAANVAIIKVWAVWQELEDIHKLKERKAIPSTQVTPHAQRKKRTPK